MQKLILPIDEFKPTAGYKNAKYRKYWGYTHYGVDCVSATRNRALYALGNGVVKAAGLDGLNGKTTGKGSGCGYCLVIIYKDCYNHKTGKVMDLVCTYMHMSAPPKVKAGDKVTPKTCLGFYGNTGAATSGPHLHIQFDTDTNYPMYCTGISSKGHALLRRGSIDSTVNPCEVLHIGAGQTVHAVFSQWYDQYAFKLLPTEGAVNKAGKEKAESDENPFCGENPVTNEDLKKQLKTYIDDKFAELDDRYKRKEDCEHDRQDTKDEIARLTTDFAVIKTELQWLVALTSIITTSVVGYIVSLIFRG